jgi:hypothetical protein
MALYYICTRADGDAGSKKQSSPQLRPTSTQPDHVLHHAEVAHDTEEDDAFSELLKSSPGACASTGLAGWSAWTDDEDDGDEDEDGTQSARHDAKEEAAWQERLSALQAQYQAEKERGAVLECELRQVTESAKDEESYRAATSDSTAGREGLEDQGAARRQDIVNMPGVPSPPPCTPVK